MKKVIAPILLVFMVIGLLLWYVLSHITTESIQWSLRAFFLLLLLIVGFLVFKGIKNGSIKLPSIFNKKTGSGISARISKTNWSKFWTNTIRVAGVFLIAACVWFVYTQIKYKVKTESNFGLGGLPPRSPEKVAKTYSYDPYPGITTLMPGETYDLKKGIPYKYQGSSFSWKLTPGQEVIKMRYDQLGDGTYWTITAPRDCTIETADHPFDDAPPRYFVPGKR